jgi:hypothetical protein
VRYYANNPVYSYTFDRQTGVFSNFYKIPIDFGNVFAGDGGCAISANSRYLYVAAFINLYQFDLEAPNISASQITVDTWDGFLDPFAIGFFHSQLGPDCKIYINGGGDTRYYHIIHNPDEPGLACGVEQRGMVFTIPSGASIPYFPNYRLGTLEAPGTPCSPLVATATPVPAREVRTWPNPAHAQVQIEGLQGVTFLRFYNALGQLQQTYPLSGNGDVWTLSVSDWEPGLYFFTAASADGILGTGRLVVQH